jgi:hypothetical protein
MVGLLQSFNARVEMAFRGGAKEDFKLETAASF